MEAGGDARGDAGEGADAGPPPGGGGGGENAETP